MKPEQYGTQLYRPIINLLVEARDGEDAIPIYRSLSAALFWYFKRLNADQQKEARRQLKDWLKEQSSDEDADEIVDDAESTPNAQPVVKERRRRNQ